MGAGAALLPALAHKRPDLHWRLVTSVEQAALELCAGGVGVAVLDTRHVEQALEMLLLQAQRCSPLTQVHVHPAGAGHSSMPALASVLAATDAAR
ncbi:hypothetical protein [Azohydromonas aeria]|uniref:hypothetical protein n=1 Tax=Azohydromonas aeria TaxID=2590212 RepID=UPI0012F856DE|nr:hypothetical protein [Azohydromonas aeria]